MTEPDPSEQPTVEEILQKKPINVEYVPTRTVMQKLIIKAT